MPVTVNCTCGKMFRVKDEMAGQPVICQVCGNTLIAPDFADSNAPPLMEPAFPPIPQSRPALYVEKIPCPHCAEPISPSARICPHCREGLSKTITRDDLVPILQDAVEKLDAHVNSAAALEEDRNAEGGFLSGKSIAAMIITAVAVAAIGYGTTFRDGVPFIVIGSIAGVISLICLIVALVNDGKASNIKGAATAEEACSKFLSACKTGRGQKAFVALVPTARVAGSVETLKFKDVGIPTHTAAYEISDAVSFKKYWKSVFFGPYGQTRQVKFNAFGARRIGSDMAVVDVELSVASYPSWAIVPVLFGIIGIIIAVILIFALQKKETQRITKLLIRRNENWYFLEGALTGKLDGYIG